ncbi:MAG: ABC transporter substrate-binding protein [Chloroflexi bacterium]|nr:ABC transporter substrate-binding protein [Chloroflexota bacterium]
MPQPALALPTATAAAPAATAPAASGAIKKGGTFTLAKPAGITQFDPLQAGPENYAWMRGLYNSLLHYDAQLNPQPELAESWDFAADGLTLSFKLRQGVKFHTGREFTSDDVKASVDFAKQDSTAPLIVAYRTISSVETPDKYTAVLRFDKINPSIFDAIETLYIIDKDTIDQRANMAVGTGPFKFDKYVPNDRVEMAAFDQYWETGKPYLDRYVVRQIPDLSSMAINLESGAVDCIWQPGYVDLARLRDEGKYGVDPGAPGAFMFALELNTRAEPFTNKLVRQAMAWSIDRARFCKTALQGFSEPATLIWPKHSWAYFPDLAGTIGFDLDKARSLLKQAGYDNGFDLELLSTSKLGPGHKELAQIIQGDLKSIGVNANINDVESAVASDRENKQDIVAVIHTFGRSNRDPGSVFAGTKSLASDKEGGWTRIDSPTYDQLRTDLQSTLDRTQRTQTAHKIEELLLDECFNNPVAYQPRGFAYANYVKGITYNMDNSPYVGDIWLDR